MFNYCSTFYGKCADMNTSFYKRNGNDTGLPDFSPDPSASLFTNYDEVDTRVCSCGPFDPETDNCNCK